MSASVARVYHNLSVMLEAGVPLVRALKSCSRSSERRMRKVLEGLTETVSQGTTIGESMRRYPGTFAGLDVTIIQQAETAGSLAESLLLLSDWHDFRRKIIKRIYSGLLLPVFLIHIAAFLAPLPSFFLGGWRVNAYLEDVAGILLLFYIPASVIYAIIFLAPARGLLRRGLDIFVLKIPLFGNAIYRLSLARYCRVFHMLYKAGVPITDCAERSCLSAGNSAVASLLRGGAESAGRGSPVSKGFSSRLPGEFLNIWQVGEESGRLEEVLDKLAQNNSERTEFLFAEFARWAPRVVYFLVSILIVYFIIKGYGTVFRRISPQL